MSEQEVCQEHGQVKGNTYKDACYECLRAELAAAKEQLKITSATGIVLIEAADKRIASLGEQLAAKESKIAELLKELGHDSA